MGLIFTNFIPQANGYDNCHFISLGDKQPLRAPTGPLPQPRAVPTTVGMQLTGPATPCWGASGAGPVWV